MTKKDIMGNKLHEFELEDVNGKIVKFEIFENTEEAPDENVKCYLLIPSERINIRSISWIYGCPVPSIKYRNGGCRILIWPVEA